MVYTPKSALAQPRPEEKEKILNPKLSPIDTNQPIAFEYLSPYSTFFRGTIDCDLSHGRPGRILCQIINEYERKGAIKTRYKYHDQNKFEESRVHVPGLFSSIELYIQSRELETGDLDITVEARPKKESKLNKILTSLKMHQIKKTLKSYRINEEKR